MYAIELFERMGKVGKGFKTHFMIHLCGAFFLFLDEIMRFLQPPLLQPASGGGMKGLFKIPFKSGQTSSREVRKYFHFNIEMKVLLHKSFQVYFSRQIKVEQDVFESRVYL